MWPYQLPIAGNAVLWWLALGVLVAGGVTSLWAANSHASWLARLTPLGLFLALMFPVGCFDPVWVFAVQAVLIIALFAAGRTLGRWRASRTARGLASDSASPGQPAAPRQGTRFSLARMLGCFTVGGALLALVSRAPHEFDGGWLADLESWLKLLAAGSGLAASTFAAWLVVSACRWQSWTLAAVIVGVAIVAIHLSEYIQWIESFWDVNASWLVTIALVVSQSLGISLMLWLIERCGWSWWRQSADAARPPSLAARIVLVSSCTFLVIPWVDLYPALIPPATPLPAVLPNPNGYDVLAGAEQKINTAALPGGDWGRASAAELRQYMQDNAALLKAMADGLELPSQPAIDYHHLSQPPRHEDLRPAYYLWEACAQAASSEGDYQQAVQYQVNGMRLGNVCANGGLTLDEAVGNAMTIQAAHQVHALLKHLTADQLREVQTQLVRVLADREPIEPLVERSVIHERLAWGWVARLLRWQAEWGIAGFGAIEELPRIRARHDVYVKLLSIECALERFRLAHGAYPATLDELVPRFLPAIPADEFTHQPLKYRRADAGYRLYSVGLNLQDDGGAAPTTQGDYEDGDLFLDP